MSEKKQNEGFGVTFTGNVSFSGPMFDIHDNENVHINVDKDAVATAYSPKQLNREELIEYVQRVISLVNDDMKEKYINVWPMFLDDKEIMSYLLQTKDRNFNHFNKYHVHGILGVMKSNGFFKKSVSDKTIAMMIENVNTETKYRSSISSGIDNSELRRLITNIIRE